MSERDKLILVVDDDRLVLATLCAGLRQAGFEVLEADNGDDAILLARKHKPRLAILDMRMQGKSGMDVARYLRSNTHTGFLFLSAFGDSDIVEEAYRLGALGYLVKPLDVKQIVPAVNTALAQVAPPAPPGPEAAAVAAPRAAPGLALATGILMERLHLDRAGATEALQAQSQREQASLEDTALRIVEAAERAAQAR